MKHMHHQIKDTCNHCYLANALKKEHKCKIVVELWIPRIANQGHTADQVQGSLEVALSLRLHLPTLRVLGVL